MARAYCFSGTGHWQEAIRSYHYGSWLIDDSFTKKFSLKIKQKCQKVYLGLSVFFDFENRQYAQANLIDSSVEGNQR